MKKKNILTYLAGIALATVTLVSCGKTYTVTFDVAGGSAVETQSVSNGKVATAPTTPTKEGYTFDGWYAGDTKYDFTTTVAGDITLTAKWIANVKSVAVSGAVAEFNIGDTFATTGLVVKATYTDNTEKTLEATAYKVDSSAVKMDTAGTYKVKVTVDGKEATYDVVVKQGFTAVATLNISTLTQSGDLKPEAGTIKIDDSFTFNSKATITTSEGTSQKAYLTIDENAKSIDGFSFTHRIKTNGKSGYDYRSISVTTTGAATIRVYAISGSSSDANRHVVMIGSDGAFVQTSEALDGKKVTANDFAVTAAGTYVIGGDAAVNIYAILIG